MPGEVRNVWQFRFSPTLKSIYVIRYLLFSGGLAVAVGVVERGLSPSTRPWGLLGGLLAGLVVFRGQLRPFSLPTLALGRDHLFFVTRAALDTIPWSRIQAATHDQRFVVIAFDQPLPLPNREPSTELRLRALEFGVTAPALCAVVHAYLDPEARRALPSDSEVRETFTR